MNAVRKIVDGNRLNEVVKLPKFLQTSRVEIIVMPILNHQEDKSLKRSHLRTLLEGSHTAELSGALSADTNTNMDELRAERRMKYECTD